MSWHYFDKEPRAQRTSTQRFLLLWSTLLAAAICLSLVHLCVAAGDTLPPGTFAGPCADWLPVNDGAFGLPSNFDASGAPTTTTPFYTHEEGFEVVVFDGQLYVGMEADNKYGARLWRTKPGIFIPTGQADWEEVAADTEERPFGNPNIPQNDHIDSLAVFEDVLYASTANRSGYALGTRIYSSTTGASGSWATVISNGFGDADNTNFKDMTVFSVTGTAWLCGGTSNVDGAQVWCTQDGATWSQKNVSGFGDSGNEAIASMDVFSGVLYAGVVNGAGGNVWRTTDLLAWEHVFTVPVGGARVEIIGSLGDYFYIASGDIDGRYPPYADYKLIRIYRSTSGDFGTWDQVGKNIRTGDANNTRTIVDGAVVYNGALYVSVMNAATGIELWRTTEGITWTQMNQDGFGDGNTFAAQMTTFNGYLYAWTSNYTDGQRVLRSACPIAQAQPVTGAGRLDFPGVGAVLTVTGGTAADVITGSVLPGALPAAQTEALPVARTYHLAAAPQTATFSGDVTLSYLDEELAVSQATSNTLYLTRWDGNQWVDCPVAQRALDAAARCVTCRNVSDFSTWAIAGTGGTPTSVSVVVHSSGDTHTFVWLGIAFVAGSGTVHFLRKRKKRIHTNLG